MKYFVILFDAVKAVASFETVEPHNVYRMCDRIFHFRSLWPLLTFFIRFSVIESARCSQKSPKILHVVQYLYINKSKISVDIKRMLYVVGTVDFLLFEAQIWHTVSDLVHSLEFNPITVNFFLIWISMSASTQTPAAFARTYIQTPDNAHFDESLAA